MMFRGRIGLYFFVILLILNLVQCWRAYGLITTTTHNPALTLKSPINTSSQSHPMKSNLINRSATTSSPIVITALVPNQIENIVITGIISGVTTFLGLFGAWSLLDWKRDRQIRPVLQIDQKENPYVLGTGIHISIYDVSKPDLPPELREISKLDLRYRVNRITVRNNGNSAAEDCKGLIINQDGREMKVCWYVPSEKHKMTINAQSSEYLDLCAFLESDPVEFAKTLKRMSVNFRRRILMEPIPLLYLRMCEDFGMNSSTNILMTRITIN